MVSTTRVPSPFSAHVRKFCRQIAPGEEPLTLRIRAESGSQPLNCFHEVQARVERDGGSMCLGWAIWEWPDVFIEAEHHAVYRDNEGTLTDLTPASDGDCERLFLPDVAAIYDFEVTGERRDNIRAALTKDPLVHQFFAVASHINDLMNAVPGVGEIKVPITLARELHRLEMEKLSLARSIGIKHTKRNAACFCGSGRKFKRCCAAVNRS